MNKKSYSQILDRVARDHLAANTDLAPHIMARVQKGKRATMQPRMKKFVLAVFVLLMIAIVLVNVPAVRAAIQRWIGYVPGIGLVSEGQIRVLAEPVSVTREGITLLVEQVLVDANQTTIVYSFEGLKAEMLDITSTVNGPGCYKDAVLRVPDNEFSPGDQIGTSWVTGYRHRAYYPVIPDTVDEVTLVVPCIRSALPGKVPEDWELSFRLIAAPPDMTAFPVIEISTPANATATALPPIDTASKLVPAGISLTLDRAVQMDDGYLIYATMHWENTMFSSLDVVGPVFHLLDTNGKEIPYSLDIDALHSVAPERGQTPLAIRTGPIAVPGPLTLVVDSVSVMVTADASFAFDLGPAPQPGQVWELNQDVDLPYGHSLRVLRATYPTPPREDLPQQSGLSFDMESDTGITGALLIDMEHPLAGGGGGGGGWAVETFGSGFSYAGAMPAGPITVNIESISVNLPGHWEAQWTPPEPQTRIAPTSQSSACLTRESWRQALQRHASLPAGLGGTLALSGLQPPDYRYQVSVTGLDGSNLKSIGFGSAPSLSPDGTRLVYMGPAVERPADGLYITDLASGNTSLLPGTTTGDMNPIWSPDGSRVAFTRGPSSGLIGAPGPYHIMMTNVDGSDLRQLPIDAEASYAAAWMPDGNHLLYTVPSRDGVSLYKLNIQTGASSLLFDANYNGTVAVSPDGKRLAFEEMLPLDKYGLFVSDLDGSNRTLLADGDPYIVTVPAWSPDGNWLLVSVHDPNNSGQPNPTLALILVDACQILPVPNLTGYVFSWLP